MTWLDEAWDNYNRALEPIRGCTMNNTVRCYIGWGPAYQRKGHMANNGVTKTRPPEDVERILKDSYGAYDTELFVRNGNFEIEFSINVTGDFDNLNDSYSLWSIEQYFETYILEVIKND